jgi:hypothetical protein
MKQTVTKKTESVHGDITHESTGASQAVISHTEEQKKQKELKKQKEHKDSVDLAKKGLVDSAAVAVGADIAVHVSTTSTDSKVAVEKGLEVSKSSMSKIETSYTSVSETILASRKLIY